MIAPLKDHSDSAMEQIQIGGQVQKHGDQLGVTADDLGQGDSRESSKKWVSSRCILKVDLIAWNFADELDVKMYEKYNHQ